MSNDLATKFVTEAMKLFGIEIFFGPVPETPEPRYPAPHAPDPAMLVKATKAVDWILKQERGSGVDRQEAVQLLLVQFYLHGYRTGFHHGQAAQKDADG